MRSIAQVETQGELSPSASPQALRLAAAHAAASFAADGLTGSDQHNRLKLMDIPAKKRIFLLLIRLFEPRFRVLSVRRRSTAVHNSIFGAENIELRQLVAGI